MNGRQCVAAAVLAVRRRAVLGALFGAILASACSSQIGKQSGGTSSAGGAGPQVVVTPIGHKSAATGGGVAITVRSGADVILSGKDSQPGIVAISSFAWSQTDPNPVTLIYLTANTVDFTAPMVAAETTLHFTLAVVDANGNKASAQATVTVEPASDPSQFLTTPVTNPRPRTFQVSVVPQANLPALSADAPICISLQRTINYTTRAGGTGSLTLPATANSKVDVSWLAAVGGTSVANAGALDTAIASYKNPRATFEVPLLNDQDLFAVYSQPQAPYQPPAVEPAATSTQRISLQLVPADVDSAYLSLAVTAAPGTCAAPASSSPLNGTALVVSVVAPDGSSAAHFTGGPDDPTSSGIVLASTQGAAAVAAPTLTIPRTDDLLTALAGSNFAETEQTAATYYATIDTMGAPGTPRAMQTLDAWLDANCFDHTAKNYGADSHSVYTNNYDLGFGRDMYFVTCTATNMQKYSPANRVVGDSASVVINYTSLEAAALQQSPFLAVAMANNKFSTSGKTPADRFAKFYVFAPDDRDGKFYLVNSANFDRRGQRYVPGACTGCHGGTVSHVTMDAGTSGDLNSSFMPWDVSALLFADTDPAFTGIAIPKKGYNAADQAAAIYSLNQHAYATYLVSNTPLASNPNETNWDRFAAPRALVEKWYCGNGTGGTGASKGVSGAACFASGVIPAADTPYQNINFVSQTFDDTAAPVIEPASGTGGSWSDEQAANADDLYHTVFAHECRACHTQLDSMLLDNIGGAPGTYRFQSYGDFQAHMQVGGANSTNSLAFMHTLMPLARLTADRFWVNYNGGASPALQLATRAGVLNSQNKVTPPGAPDITAVSANLVTAAGTTLSSSLLAPLTSSTTVAGLTAGSRFGSVLLDASSSFFASNYSWSLCVIAPPSLSATTASLNGTCAPVAAGSPASMLGATTAVPALGTPAAGIYELTLDATSATQQSAAQTFAFNVTRTVPVVPATCTWTIIVGTTNPSLDGGTVCGSILPGDGSNAVSIVSNTTAYAVTATLAPNGTDITFNMSAPTGVVSGTQGTIVYALTDSADGAAAQGQITVASVSTPIANSAIYYTYMPLQGSTVPTGVTTPILAPVGATAPWTVSIPVDSTPAPARPCSAPGGSALSLANFFTPSNCADPFTLTFAPVPTGAPVGNVTIGGTDTISVATSALPTLTYTGIPIGTAAPVVQWSYLVNDSVTHLASSQSSVTVYSIETQTFGGPPASGTPIGAGLAAAPTPIINYLSPTPTTMCAICHDSGNAVWDAADGATGALGSSGSAKGLASGTCDAAAVTEFGAGVKCLNTANNQATTSAIYKVACNPSVVTHQGTTVTKLSGPQCANLVQWITEGANLH